MSLSVAVIDALLATGATREQIAAAVKADIAVREADEAAKLEKKRVGNRDRQQRKRELDNAESRVTAVTARDKRDTPPNEDILTPPRLPTKPIGLEPTPKKHRLPADWEPLPFKAGSMAALTVIRWEPGRMERELAKFRDHHTAAGTRHEVWQAAWSKWVNGSEGFQRGRNGGQQQPGIGKTTAAIAALGEWNDDRPM